MEGQWEGWNTQLKPAWEPILLFRNPVRGTIAENMDAHGAGGLHVDACRIPVEPSDTIYKKNPHTVSKAHAGNTYGRYAGKDTPYQVKGRYPANLLHDGTTEACSVFPQTGKSAGGGGLKTLGKHGIYREARKGHFYDGAVGYQDEGTAARYFPALGWREGEPRAFYCPKASRSERGTGNTHPTVKPIALMEWLLKLLVPPGGKVLDPFCGSGTTLVAARVLAVDAIGIEIDPDYAALARRRLDDTSEGLF